MLDPLDPIDAGHALETPLKIRYGDDRSFDVHHRRAARVGHRPHQPERTRFAQHKGPKSDPLNEPTRDADAPYGSFVGQVTRIESSSTPAG